MHVLELPRVLALQVPEQGLGLQTRIHLEGLLDLRPHLLERIRPVAPGMWDLDLAGQFPGPQVCAGRLLVHPRLGGGDSDWVSTSNARHQSPHLRVGDHLTSMAYKGLDPIHYRP